MDQKLNKHSNFTDQCPGDLLSGLSNNQSVQALALAQAAKVDRKLYIGNLPSGITSSTVYFSKLVS